MICLISGKPNTGKSTALRKIADFLGIKRCAGLLAQEIMKEGERIGFSSHGLLCNEDIILAHKEFSKDHAVEDFGVVACGECHLGFEVYFVDIEVVVGLGIDHILAVGRELGIAHRYIAQASAGVLLGIY